MFMFLYLSFFSNGEIMVHFTHTKPIPGFNDNEYDVPYNESCDDLLYDDQIIPWLIASF